MLDVPHVTALTRIILPVLRGPRQQQRLHGSRLTFRKVFAGFEFLQNGWIRTPDVRWIQRAGHVAQHIHIISTQIDSRDALNIERHPLAP